LRALAGVAGIPGSAPRLATAFAGPQGLMPILVPTVVPLVPANEANESGLHSAHLR
jgi:hypothetical protein